MKVTHICTSLSGGAGICASRIIKATKCLGVDARVIVAQGVDNDETSVAAPQISWSDKWYIQKLQALLAMMGVGAKSLKVGRKITLLQNRYSGTYCFTSPLTGYTKLFDHPWVKEADIIHLHWIGQFVDYETFFPKINKPIVWTIHDENPGLGGFHYTSWKNEAPESFQRLDDELMVIKQEAYKQVKAMTLVAISNQMRLFFQQSKLLSRFPSVLIHNGIDGQLFQPIPKQIAKEVLGIPDNAIVFLFSAQNIHEGRKGLKELIAALEALKIPNMILICLGNYEKVPEASFEIRCEGFISNNRLQSLYNSAADFYMMPSFQEAFAQTPMEAMACGTPVIAFPCSGTKDLINEENGIVCKDFTTESLIEGIRQAMKCPYNREVIRKNLLDKFSYSIIAKQYLTLYQNILECN